MAGPHGKIPRRGAADERHPARPDPDQRGGAGRGVMVRLLAWILLILPVTLSAQGTDTAAAPRNDSAIVRAVVIDLCNDSATTETGFIPRLANALHIQTRAVTVRRELLFKP